MGEVVVGTNLWCCSPQEDVIRITVVEGVAAVLATESSHVGVACSLHLSSLVGRGRCISSASVAEWRHHHYSIPDGLWRFQLLASQAGQIRMRVQLAHDLQLMMVLFCVLVITW